MVWNQIIVQSSHTNYHHAIYTTNTRYEHEISLLDSILDMILNMITSYTDIVLDMTLRIILDSARICQPLLEVICLQLYSSAFVFILIVGVLVH